MSNNSGETPAQGQSPQLTEMNEANLEELKSPVDNDGTILNTIKVDFVEPTNPIGGVLRGVNSTGTGYIGEGVTDNGPKPLEEVAQDPEQALIQNRALQNLPETNVAATLENAGFDPSSFGHSINFPPSVAYQVEPDDAYWETIQRNSTQAQAIQGVLPPEVSQLYEQQQQMVNEVFPQLKALVEQREREAKRVANLEKAREAKRSAKGKNSEDS